MAAPVPIIEKAYNTDETEEQLKHVEFLRLYLDRKAEQIRKNPKKKAV
jgi:hypothetical protein